MAQGRVVAQGEAVVAFDVVGGSDGGEGLGLFDGVDAEVGFQVEVQVEQVGGVAGLLGHDLQHPRLHLVAGRRRGVARRPAVGGGGGVAGRCGECGGAFVDEGDDVAQGRVVAQGEAVVAFDVVGGSDGGEGLGLFDGVDAQVGFQVEVQVEQVGGVAGLLGHDRPAPAPPPRRRPAPGRRSSARRGGRDSRHRRGLGLGGRCGRAGVRGPRSRRPTPRATSLPARQARRPPAGRRRGSARCAWRSR